MKVATFYHFFSRSKIGGNAQPVTLPDSAPDSAPDLKADSAPDSKADSESPWESTSKSVQSAKLLPAIVLNIDRVQKELEESAHRLNIRGLIILAPEGFNATVAGSDEELRSFTSNIEAYLKIEVPLFIKYSPAEKYPFKIFKVKVRDEIVTTTRPDLTPDDKEMRDSTHLSPAQWDQTLKQEGADIFLVDTRNWYETQVGTFKNAVNPNISEFTEFPEFIEKQNLPKDKKILMYCTGGIRCEKGILDMKERGYNNVFQLDGGILNYLNEFPNSEFEGECFVFDHRVAVKQDLTPSTQFGLCPHCGQPATTHINCARCEFETNVCYNCSELVDHPQAVTCSKNCAYHWQKRPGVKGPRQMPGFQQSDLAELRRLKHLRKLELNRKLGE